MNFLCQVLVIFIRRVCLFHNLSGTLAPIWGHLGTDQLLLAVAGRAWEPTVKCVLINSILWFCVISTLFLCWFYTKHGVVSTPTFCKKKDSILCNVVSTPRLCRFYTCEKSGLHKRGVTSAPTQCYTANITVGVVSTSDLMLSFFLQNVGVITTPVCVVSTPTNWECGYVLGVIWVSEYIFGGFEQKFPSVTILHAFYW